MHIIPENLICTTEGLQIEGAVEEIKKIIQGERNSELLYDYLISIAPNKEQQEILQNLKCDLQRHSILFRRIYKDFTAIEAPITYEEIFEEPQSYIDGVKRALLEELKLIEKCREIKCALGTECHRDIVFDIITEKIKHSFKYNYLFTLNKGIKFAECNCKKELEKNNKRPSQSICDFVPDQWIEYIDPLVKGAMVEAEKGVNPKHVYQEFILAGILVGLGKSPEEAIKQVEQWEKSGESVFLEKSKRAR